MESVILLVTPESNNHIIRVSLAGLTFKLLKEKAKEQTEIADPLFVVHRGNSLFRLEMLEDVVMTEVLSSGEEVTVHSQKTISQLGDAVEVLYSPTPERIGRGNQEISVFSTTRAENESTITNINKNNNNNESMENPHPGIVSGGEIAETGVFVAHAGKQYTVADAIYETLSQKGISVFLDTHSFVPGLANVLGPLPKVESSMLQLHYFLALTQAVVVILSDNFLDSLWCKFELEEAVKTARQLIIVDIVKTRREEAEKILAGYTGKQVWIKDAGDLLQNNEGRFLQATSKVVGEISRHLEDTMEKLVWKCRTCGQNAFLVRDYSYHGETRGCKFCVSCPNHHEKLIVEEYKTASVSQVEHLLEPPTNGMFRIEPLKEDEKKRVNCTQVQWPTLPEETTLAEFLLFSFTACSDVCVSDFGSKQYSNLGTAWLRLVEGITKLKSGEYTTPQEFLRFLKESFPTRDDNDGAIVNLIFTSLTPSTEKMSLEDLLPRLERAVPGTKQLLLAHVSMMLSQHNLFSLFEYDFGILASDAPLSCGLQSSLRKQLESFGYSVQEGHVSDKKLSARCLLVIMDNTFLDQNMEVEWDRWQVVVPIFAKGADLDNNDWVYKQYPNLTSFPGVDFCGKGFKDETTESFERRIVSFISRILASARPFGFSVWTNRRFRCAECGDRLMHQMDIFLGKKEHENDVADMAPTKWQVSLKCRKHGQAEVRFGPLQ